MKRITYLILLLLSSCGISFAQNTTTLPTGTSSFTPSFRYKPVSPDSLNQVWAYNPLTGKYNRWFTATETIQAISAAAPTLTGFTVLQQPTIGTVIAPGTSVDLAFKQLFAPPQPATASFTPDLNLQYSGSSTASNTFSYAYGKQTGTSNILDAKLNGSTTGITQNANGASGTISKTFSTNTQTVYTFVVRTNDVTPIITTRTATVNYYPFYYVGTCAGTTPTSSEVLAATTSGLSAGTDYNMNFTFTGSNLHVFYAYYNAYPTVTSVKDAAGNQAIAAMTLSTVAITDNGFSGTWKTVTTNNTYTNANIVLTIRQ